VLQINLPFGFLVSHLPFILVRLLTSKQSILAVLFFLKSTPVMDLPGNEGKSKLQKWIGIDWLGTILCLGMIIPLVLGLQWGGNIRAWNDKVVIICFIVVSRKSKFNGYNRDACFNTGRRRHACLRLMAVSAFDRS
jgi:hypothetical protein